MLRGKIEFRANLPYFVFEERMYLEPKKYRLLWLLTTDPHDIKWLREEHPETLANARLEYGIVTAYRPSYGITPTLRFRVGDDDRTPCTLKEMEDVPPPKTKKPLRWEHERWEKLLAKGWVPA